MKIALVLALLSGWMWLLPVEGHADSFDDFNCNAKLVYCIDANGKGLPRESAKFRVSETVTIAVIDKAVQNETTTIEIDGSTGNSLLPRATVSNRASLVAALIVESKLATKTYKIPNTDEIHIQITQTDSGGNIAHQATTSIPIDDTLYFARPALAFAWVRDGSRKIGADRAVVTTTDFFPAVALEVWPWGHRSTALAGFERTKGSHGRWLGDMVALQIGTHLDFTNAFKRAFFGITIEPISGIGFSMGVAVTPGQFFSGGFASSSDSGVTEDSMWNQYFAITITPEIYDSLRKLAGKKD